MKSLIRYLTRWAWKPVITEFVLRQVRTEKIANNLARALGYIANGGDLPVQAARSAIKKFKEGVK